MGVGILITLLTITKIKKSDNKKQRDVMTINRE